MIFDANIPPPLSPSEPLRVHAVDELEEELLRESDLVHLGDALDPLQDVALLLLHVRPGISATTRIKSERQGLQEYSVKSL